MEFSQNITFSPDQESLFVSISLSEDDVFPEENKTFEVFLSPASGVFINPIAYATVTILNDDPELPGM